MTLRRKFLFVALASALVPWLGWQAVIHVAASMRGAQEHALLGQASTLAHALAQLPIEVLPAAGGVPVLRSRSAIRVDGYADDWPAGRSTDPSNSSSRVTLALDSRRSVPAGGNP